ncbi:MAG: carbamoyltransferase N-terminal domain-containing protein [Microgenomates group bacterium]
MIILGISAFYHDSAAALIVDGKVIAALEEERFTRIKHDNQFPRQAITRLLQLANYTIDDINVIAYYEKPLLKFERLLETFVTTYPYALRPFLQAIPDWLSTKINVEHVIRKDLHFTKQIMYVPHHLSHAASSFFTSPFAHAAILTIDGVGEYETTGLWSGKNNTITHLASIDFPNSVGLLYSTVTAFLGFKINEDEYKVMGLAAYGKPVYEEQIRTLIDVKPDGSFKLDMRYFGFQTSFCMWNKKFEKLLGTPRKPHDVVEKRHKDIAASVQKVTEELLISMLNHLSTLTKEKNLCMSGGVALNALANGKLYARTPFKKIHILGSSSDSGTAIGAALYVYYNFFGSTTIHHLPLPTLALGTSPSDEDIERILSQFPGLSYQKITDEKILLKKAVNLLASKKIIGWFQGAMEFGPRALGNRSILSATNPRSMKTKMNIIKHREQFRPFAGSALQETIHDYFDVPQKKHGSPFMNFCFQVKKQKQDALAAIVHQDESCRIQTVSPENGRYYHLLKTYAKKTHIDCIMNTSFNLQGEPIVETPRQAIEDFLKTPMHCLIINNYLITK